MTRLLFGVLALAACAPAADRAPAAKENAVTSTGQPGAPPTTESGPQAIGHNAASPGEHAAQGPTPEPVSAAANPAPGPTGDSAAEARGRRTLSTAFVRVGPDNLLTVGLRDGRALVLRDVAMRLKDYCGLAVGGDGPARKHCGSYADVVSARPGGTEPQQTPDLAAPNPLPQGE